MEYKTFVIVNDGIVEGLRLMPRNQEIQNELFFKHENESEVDFFNKRIIPLFLEKGIDIRKYYVSDNIEIIDEKDFVLEENDNINITKKQIGDILTSINLQDLYYDEQLYVAQVYKQYNQKKFNFQSDDNWNTSRSDILFAMCLEIDNPKSIEQVLPSYFKEEDVDFILKNLPVVAFDGKITYRWTSKHIESSLETIISEKLNEKSHIENKVEGIKIALS